MNATYCYMWHVLLNPSILSDKNNPKIKRNLFFFELKKFDIIPTLSCFLLCDSTRNKYAFLQSVLQNPFFTQSQKDEFLDIFILVQKRYFALSRFAYLWKWKRAVLAIDTDLFLNTIDAQKRHSFVLCRGKTKFQFIISDLMRLMEMAIWHNWEGCFRVISQAPSNPYTKQEFRTVDLYNIYYHMKWKMDIIIPQFFQLWFLDEFCLDTFKRKNDQYIRKMCIRQFTKTTSNKNILLYKNAKEMLSEYHFTCKWRIHDDFPKDVLVDAMRPYLYLHYLITFDILSIRQASYIEVLLHRELLRFYAFNKSFGLRKPCVILTKELINKPPQFKLDFLGEATQASVTEVVVKNEPFHMEKIEFSSWHL